MYRVATSSIDHRGRLVTEFGPWQASYPQVKYWADLLRRFGYSVRIESQSGELPPDGGDTGRLDALSHMA